MITLDALTRIRRTSHGFFTRAGGVSAGLYANLNCGVGSRDDPACVAANRARAMACLGLLADRLVTVYQVHGPTVVVVERPWAAAEAPRADAMVTTTPGVALGILTADCAPLLFADAREPIVGAAHAGWRGAKGGVIEATVDAMVAAGARRPDIVVGIGPCIAQRSYEVGPEFPGPFLDESAANADFFIPAPRVGHFLFDLAGYVARRLGACGVTRVEICHGDTAGEADRFFSYRRATLHGEPDYGRLLSAIVLAEAPRRP